MVEITSIAITALQARNYYGHARIGYHNSFIYRAVHKNFVIKLRFEPFKFQSKVYCSVLLAMQSIHTLVKLKVFTERKHDSTCWTLVLQCE